MQPRDGTIQRLNGCGQAKCIFIGRSGSFGGLDSRAESQRDILVSLYDALLRLAVAIEIWVHLSFVLFLKLLEPSVLQTKVESTFSLCESTGTSILDSIHQRQATD